MAKRSSSRSKYAQLTVFDPSTAVARLVPTTAPQAAPVDEGVPLLARAYACDDADDVTLEQLRALSGESMNLLMAKRHYAASPEELQRCPAQCPATRRRCWRCPFKTPDDDDLPF